MEFIFPNVKDTVTYKLRSIDMVPWSPGIASVVELECQELMKEV